MSAFDRLDKNHDGVITRAEFAQLAQQCLHSTGWTKTTTALLPGRSLHNWRSNVCIRQVGQKPRRRYYQGGVCTIGAAMSAFDRLDKNHDGVITRAEFAQLAQQCLHSTGWTKTTTALLPGRSL